MLFTLSITLECIHDNIASTVALRAKTFYPEIGINMKGEKEVLGL